MGALLTTAYRRVDRPTHTVDVFGDVAIVSVYADCDVDSIVRELPQSTVYLKRRPKEARKVVQGEAAPVEPLRGPRVEQLIAYENGLQFEIRPENGLSVGLYVDAADIRKWVMENSAGKTVLNLFAYTCGFSVAARAGGAVRAVNVDLSRKVLDWGERNHQLNDLSVDRRDFISGDVFEWLRRFTKKGERFDLVVLDPPSFANAPKSRFSAAHDYARLVSEVAPLVKERLVACCNLETASTDTVRKWISQSMKVEKPLSAPGALKVFVARH